VPRKIRAIVPDCPYHIVQRGDNRNVAFISDKNFRTGKYPYICFSVFYRDMSLKNIMLGYLSETCGLIYTLDG